VIVSRLPRVGHAAREIAVPLFILFLWDVVVTLAYLRFTPSMETVELPTSLFGTALALFIGFAVNASYARWWEARSLWGQMINASRSIARQAVTLCRVDEAASRPDLARDIVYAQIAYVNVLRTTLRGQPTDAEAARLPVAMAEELASKINKPNAIVTDIGLLAAEAAHLGLLDTFAQVRIETTLVDIANAQGGMERIKNTPLPSQYRFFPSFFAKLFCVILPFAVVPKLGAYTPLGSALVGLMFLMAVQIGRDLMDPFANDIYDVPMSAMCRTIEIDLLQTIGEPAPEKMQPVDGVLW
jgi:ion channel-forming bestrophin family protein